jgi:hypothetical protein
MFRFRFFLHNAYTVHACALTSILSSLSIMGIIYCAADTKATPASVQGVGVDFFIDMDLDSPQRCETCTQPSIQWEPGALSLGVKRPGREADRWPHLVPRSRKGWRYTSLPQYAFMAWCSVEAQGQLYLYLSCSYRLSPETFFGLPSQKPCIGCPGPWVEAPISLPTWS